MEMRSKKKQGHVGPSTPLLIFIVYCESHGEPPRDVNREHIGFFVRFSLVAVL